MNQDLSSGNRELRSVKYNSHFVYGYFFFKYMTPAGLTYRCGDRVCFLLVCVCGEGWEEVNERLEFAIFHHHTLCFSGRSVYVGLDGNNQSHGNQLHKISDRH